MIVLRNKSVSDEKSGIYRGAGDDAVVAGEATEG